MRAEGGQALFDALLITNISKHRCIAANLTAAISWNMQPSQGHTGHQADQFQGYRLATGIRASDDHRCNIFIQMHIDRHHSCRRNQGVTGLHQAERAVGIELGSHGVHLVAELAFGKDKIQPR